MSESVAQWAPLEWTGIGPEEQGLLAKVIIERDTDDLVVSDAVTARELLRIAPEDLRQRSLVPMLLHRLGDFYCTGCGTLLNPESPLCTGCDKDRAQRLRDTIALLEEDA